jgi:probable rRNA maturation factor
MTTFTIDVHNENHYPIDAAGLIDAARAVLIDQEVEGDHALTIVIATDDEVAALNAQYRAVEGPTDVLSFPADEPPVDLPDEPIYLGDLVIAYPYAEAQAAREGHLLRDNLALLVIHGTLHLLGHDHDSEAARAVMWEAQARALSALGISPQIVPAWEADSDDTA